MPRWIVKGANRQTGEEETLRIVAPNRAAAILIANRQGFMVEEQPAPEEEAATTARHQCAVCKEAIQAGAMMCPHCRQMQPKTALIYLVLVIAIVGFVWFGINSAMQDYGVKVGQIFADAEREGKRLEREAREQAMRDAEEIGRRLRNP